MIEDACEAIGAEVNNKKVGTFGDVGVFAFYPNKQVTTGEGGMLITNDHQVYSLCKNLRNQGRSEKGRWLAHERLDTITELAISTVHWAFRSLPE